MRAISGATGPRFVASDRGASHDGLGGHEGVLDVASSAGSIGEDSRVAPRSLRYPLWMARRASIAQFALATVAALACACAGGANDGRGGAAPAASSSSAVAAAPANAKVGRDVGNLAPDFEAKDVEGKAFKLSDYRGKVVLLDFWGFW